MVVIPEIGQKEKNRRIACASHLKQIGLSLHMYAEKNAGFFPNKNGVEGLEMLRLSHNLGNLTPSLQCPTVREQQKKGKVKVEIVPPFSEDEVCYEYIGGYKDSDSKDIPIAWDKANNHRDYGNVLYIDGRVIGYNGTDWLKNTKKERTKSLQGTEYSH